jgi:cellulose synthase/poly-beta-1,6-N-acetylglucosamine synthase-like glycosyltransferase
LTIGILDFLLAGTGLILLLLATVLFLEVVSALTIREPLAPDIEDEAVERKRLTILVPAHNESANIAVTLRSITPELGCSDRLIVVAHNCSDDTAAVAAHGGAEVIVRVDRTRRGKGYALDYGMRFLEGDPPDIVVVVDADCQLAPGSVDRLARLCARTDRPVQAMYLMHATRDAGLRMRISEFAFLVKNQVRALGLHQLGFPCQLMGSGMAFPWKTLNRATLATGHIVEDLKLGIDLACAGAPTAFCPDALVNSDFPASSDGIKSQRTRWEHGHIGVILKEAPRLLLQSIVKRDFNLMALAIDLSVPPLALLSLLVAIVWCASFLLYLIQGSSLPLKLATMAGILLGLSVLLSWHRYGRRIVSLGELAFAVLYVFWKVPMYVKFVVARQLDWVRSRRDEKKT